MDIRGSGRRIEDKEIKISPVSIGNELLQSIGSHTASPKGCRFRIHKKTDAQQFHAVLLDGRNQVATVYMHCIGPFVFHMEHFRDGRSEYVRIQEAHLIAKPGQTDGQIG